MTIEGEDRGGASAEAEADPDSLEDLDVFLHNMVTRNRAHVRELLLLRAGPASEPRPPEAPLHFSSRHAGADGRSLRSRAAQPSAEPLDAGRAAGMADAAAGPAPALGGEASLEDEALAREMLALSGPALASGAPGVQQPLEAPEGGVEGGVPAGEQPEAVVLERGLLGDPESASKVDCFFFAGERCGVLDLEGERYSLVWREEVGERVVAHLASAERGLMLDSTCGFVLAACFDLPEGEPGSKPRRQAAEIVKMLATGLADYLIENGL